MTLTATDPGMVALGIVLVAIAFVGMLLKGHE